MENRISITVSKKQYKLINKFTNLLNDVYLYVESQTNDLVGEYNKIFKNLEDHLHVSCEIIEIDYASKNYGLTFSSNRWKNCLGQQIFISLNNYSYERHFNKYIINFEILNSKGKCPIINLLQDTLVNYLKLGHLQNIYDTIVKNYAKVIYEEGLKEFGLTVSDINKNYYLKYEITKDILDFVKDNSLYTDDEINQMSDSEIYKLYTDLQRDFYGD